MILEKLVWGFAIKMKTKKGQFLVFSIFLFLSFLLFTYSIETENSYISSSGKNYIQKSIFYETCQIGYSSNGSQIESRYSDFASNLGQYCTDLGITCYLSIENNTQVPPLGNYSLLNYSHFDYSLYYLNGGFQVNMSFRC